MYPSANGAPYHHHHLHHHQFQHATHNMLPYYSTAPPAAQQQQQQVLVAPPPSPPHAAPASYAPLQLVQSHFPSQHLLQPPQPHVATPSSSYYPSTLINTTPQLHPLMDNTTSNVVQFIPSSSSYTPPSASLYNSATVPSSSTALGVTSSSSSPHSNIVPQPPPSPFTFYVTPTYAPNPNHIASSPPSMLVVAASQPEAPVTYNVSNMTVYAARPPPPSAVGWGSDSAPSMFTTPSNTVPNFSLAYVDSSANASPADPALTVTPGGSATTPSTPVLDGVKGLTFSASKQKRSSKPIVLPLALPGNTQGCLQLVVHYLAPDITEAALQQLFEATVPGCTHARIAIDPSTGRSRGFGYVWYSTQQDAIRAMEETNGRVLSRKRIRVLFASPQSEPW